MTEEKADQICRCVKECWWRIAVLLLIPAVVAIALTSPWPWKESPWVALGVIATFSASAIALWLGLEQVRRDEQRLEREGRVIAATIWPVIQKTASILKECVDEVDANDVVDVTDLTKDQISSLWGLERVTLQHILAISKLHPYESSVLSQNVNFVLSILEYYGLPKTKTKGYFYRGFIRNIQKEEIAKDLREIAGNLRRLEELLGSISYKK